MPKLKGSFGLLVLCVMLVFMLLAQLGALHDVSLWIWFFWSLLGVVLAAAGI